MKALLVALTLNFTPSVDSLPTIEVEPFPHIVSAFMLNHNGQKYLCGTASKSNRHDNFRFVFSLEQDWQVYEPVQNDPTWEQVDQTIMEICEAGE